MIRTTFYYKKNNVNFIFAVKHCKRPAQTKVYKHLIKLLDNDKVDAIGYTTNTINY